MVKLTVDNIIVAISGLEYNDETQLWNKLSFRVEVFGQEPRYRHLYNRKTKKTYTGLLPYVIEFLDALELEYEITDIREKPEPNADFKLVEFLDEEKTIPFKPREYQTHLVQNCGERAVIQAATGAGKAVPLNTLILTPKGFVPMRDIHYNDIVYDENGNETKVVGEYLQGELEEYEIVFEDNVKIKCCKDHLWKFATNTKEIDNNKIDWQVETLEYIMNNVLPNNENVFIPICNTLKTYDGLTIKERIKFVTDNIITKKGKYDNQEEQHRYEDLARSVGVRTIKEKNDVRVLKLTTPGLKIKAINKLNTKSEMKCIKVDSETHTYICENFIVTHNTCMMAMLIAKFNVKPVCIFADKISLCRQIQQEISKFLGVEVGLVGDGEKDYKDITVISLQSAEEDYIKDAKLAMFDECHHVPSTSCVNVSNACKNAYYKVGVSATPWRDAGDDMLIEACLSKVNEERINASKLIELGYLMNPKIFFVPVSETFKGKNYIDTYNKAIVENKNRNKMIYRITRKMYAKGHSILILVRNVAHGELLRDELLKRIGEEVYPITINNPKNGKETTVRVKNVEFLSGSDDSLRREAIITSAKKGECRIICATSVADEGLDLPRLSVLILAGGGKSSTRAFQRIGRVIRLHPDKKNAYVFDFWDATPMLLRHSRQRKKLYQTEPLWEISKFNVDPDAEED